MLDRYTLTYAPSLDPTLPSPSILYVKVRNTSAIPLRAAYLHGPYTLYAACYPSTFDPNYSKEAPYRDGNPHFEPNLKAGGSWNASLKVPEPIRETKDKANVKRKTDGGIPSFTWIIEITSQVIFSNSASVNFELLVGRDEKAVELGISGMMGTSSSIPGQLQDHQQGKKGKSDNNAVQPNGVYSNAVSLVVDDTTSLWNKPLLPEWEDQGKDRGKKRDYPDPGEEDVLPQSSGQAVSGSRDGHGHTKPQGKRRKKIHLVVLTHGLHSNLGADMLYVKESIDAAAKKAREDARARRKKDKDRGRVSDHQQKEVDDGTRGSGKDQGTSTAPLSGGQDSLGDAKDSDDENEEEVIVRGFSGNAVRTERGIKYLGKRLAKYVLAMTYPDQPFLPVKKSVTRTISRALTGQESIDKRASLASHTHSTIQRASKKPDDLAYQITSISFIGHSLGGLTQTYAIAYIHKHSPQFFDRIKPINFIALASPFLGLSNENPIYVKFALDFGLVGRTGQDLGLTWRAPTMVRSGWGAMIGGIGSEGQRAVKNTDPGSKPLLRILPTGPAHVVLKMFRNRTIYSNVVNDGIVPLRTSCLLFLDWRGLGRVEKARRENGLVGTMASWGWSEIIGTNSSSRHVSNGAPPSDESSDDEAVRQSHPGEGSTVPQPDENATREDTATTHDEKTEELALNGRAEQHGTEGDSANNAKETSSNQQTNLFSGLLSLLRPKSPNPPQKQRHSSKQNKIYTRSQTVKAESDDKELPSSGTSTSPPSTDQISMHRESIAADPSNVFTPPKTTFFESAGDVLNPPLPSEEFLINPASRPRTIFHDRIYHPDDIPPVPSKRRPKSSRSFSSDSVRSLKRVNTDYGDSGSTPDTGGMKVEEKIARAYHHDISWRKVLVRLEPDAHNNMIVRRMFANAYGWPVVKHLVDTHFADTYEAKTPDRHEAGEECAKPMEEGVGDHGEEVKPQSGKAHERTKSEIRESKDNVPEMTSPPQDKKSSARPKAAREDSAKWDDIMFEGSDDDEDIFSSIETRHPTHRYKYDGTADEDEDEQKGTSETEIAEFLSATPPRLEKDLSLLKLQDLDAEDAEKGSPGLVQVESPGGTTRIGLGKSVEDHMGLPVGLAKKTV